MYGSVPSVYSKNSCFYQFNALLRDVPKKRNNFSNCRNSSIDEQGIPTTVYSTLPAGMETTVKLRLNDDVITGVVFGSVDYAVNTPLNINFNGNKIILFDKNTTNRIAFGSLKIK